MGSFRNGQLALKYQAGNVPSGTTSSAIAINNAGFDRAPFVYIVPDLATQGKGGIAAS
jgi:hypothetical protein